MKYLSQLREETGQAITEYAMLIAFLALVVVPGMLFMTWAVGQLFVQTGKAISQPPSATQPKP